MDDEEIKFTLQDIARQLGELAEIFGAPEEVEPILTARQVYQEVTGHGPYLHATDIELVFDSYAAMRIRQGHAIMARPNYDAAHVFNLLRIVLCRPSDEWSVDTGRPPCPYLTWRPSGYTSPALTVWVDYCRPDLRYAGQPQGPESIYVDFGGFSESFKPSELLSLLAHVENCKQVYLL